MVTLIKTLVPRAGVILRNSAVTLLAGICRWRSINEINERVTARPVQEQAMITGAVLLALFALCLVAAQFGWIGILAFWMIVILLVN